MQYTPIVTDADATGGVCLKLVEAVCSVMVTAVLPSLAGVDDVHPSVNVLPRNA